MRTILFTTLVLAGFTACAEFGSYAFVHPVIRKLPPRHHLFVEQGLLRTFGIFMPPAMTGSAVLAVILAVRGPDLGATSVRRYLAAGLIGAALLSTIMVNVPINLATSRWDSSAPPGDWQRRRARWELFQGVRSWLLLLGFIALCVSVSL